MHRNKLLTEKRASMARSFIIHAGHRQHIPSVLVMQAANIAEMTCHANGSAWRAIKAGMKHMEEMASIHWWGGVEI